MNGQVVDYEMGVHVFGGTSSPGCFRYVLRRTAIENEPNYDTEVAETLIPNFYIDDLLKSMESEEILTYFYKQSCLSQNIN